jgi:hypothetical protein
MARVHVLSNVSRVWGIGQCKDLSNCYVAAALLHEPDLLLECECAILGTVSDSAQYLAYRPVLDDHPPYDRSFLQVAPTSLISPHSVSVVLDRDSGVLSLHSILAVTVVANRCGAYGSHILILGVSVGFSV